MFRKTISILIAIIFISIFSIVIHAESNLTTKLKENLIPLKTVEVGNGFEDLIIWTLTFIAVNFAISKITK